MGPSVGPPAGPEDPQDGGWCAARASAAPSLHDNISLQIRNTVRDFETWKAAFDKFERFRAEHGVRSYRVLRRADDEHDVQVILDFDTAEAAVEFRGHLEQIWRTPQSRGRSSSTTTSPCCSRTSAGSPGGRSAISGRGRKCATTRPRRGILFAATSDQGGSP